MQGSLKKIAEEYKEVLGEIDWENLDYETFYRYISSFQIDYTSLRERNLQLFETDDRFAEKRAALNSIAKALNDAGVRYEFCCSFSLFLYGIVDDFDDFDIVLDPDPENIKKAKKAFKKIGQLKRAPQKHNFSKKALFLNLVVNGMENDVFGGFYFRKIDGDVIEEEFDYVPGLSAEGIQGQLCKTEVCGLSIPVTPPETSACFYREMSNWQEDRDIKTLLILIFLANNGINYPEHFPEWYLKSLNPMVCSIFEHLPMPVEEASQLSLLESKLGSFGKLLKRIKDFLKSPYTDRAVYDNGVFDTTSLQAGTTIIESRNGPTNDGKS